MRVVLKYTAAEPHLVIKVKLPKKWLNGPTDNLKTTLVDAYNSKHPDSALDAAAFHLELGAAGSGVVLASDEMVCKRVPDRAELFLVAGASPTAAEMEAQAQAQAEAAKPKEDPDDPILTCRLYGCQKKYRESENHDTFCRYHVKPPIFHETAKYWSCCPNQKAYDWETFMGIPGCAVGRCSTVAPGTSVLGGSDVRAAAQAKNEFAPQRIDGGGGSGDASAAPAALPAEPLKAEFFKGRVVTPLDKLSTLRKALVSIGVDGEQYDSARDTVKERHEELGAEVWKQVADDMAAAFNKTLESLEMGKQIT